MAKRRNGVDFVEVVRRFPIGFVRMTCSLLYAN